MSATYEKGFIILPRDEFDDPFFDDFWNRAAWMELLTRARGVASAELRRAQFRASYREIASWLHATELQVRRFLSRLAEMGRLVVDAAATNRAPAVYRVLNFDRYNGSKPSKTPAKSQRDTQIGAPETAVEETRARLVDNGERQREEISSPLIPSSAAVVDESFEKPPALVAADRWAERVVGVFQVAPVVAQTAVHVAMIRHAVRCPDLPIRSVEFFRGPVREFASQKIPQLYPAYVRAKLAELPRAP